MPAPACATRFAPSPTGRIHLGNAFSALDGWRRARDAGGRFILRIEDINRSRCRPEHEAALVADLRWLGLDRDGPVWHHRVISGPDGRRLAKRDRPQTIAALPEASADPSVIRARLLDGTGPQRRG